MKHVSSILFILCSVLITNISAHNLMNTTILPVSNNKDYFAENKSMLSKISSTGFIKQFTKYSAAKALKKRLSNTTEDKLTTAISSSFIESCVSEAIETILNDCKPENKYKISNFKPEHKALVTVAHTALPSMCFTLYTNSNNIVNITKHTLTTIINLEISHLFSLFTYTAAGLIGATVSHVSAGIWNHMVSKISPQPTLLERSFFTVVHNGFIKPIILHKFKKILNKKIFPEGPQQNNAAQQNNNKKDLCTLTYNTSSALSARCIDLLSILWASKKEI